MVHIIIDEGIHERLGIYKIKSRSSSFNDTIKKLLDENDAKQNTPESN